MARVAGPGWSRSRVIEERYLGHVSASSFGIGRVTRANSREQLGEHASSAQEAGIGSQELALRFREPVDVLGLLLGLLAWVEDAKLDRGDR